MQKNVFVIDSTLENFIEDIIVSSLNKESIPNYPPTDIYTENNKVFVEIAIAKFQEKEISILFENNILTIIGYKEKKEDVENRVYINKAIATRKFIRKISFPFLVNEIEYELKDGVLFLEISPKIEEQNKIKIIKKN